MDLLENCYENMKDFGFVDSDGGCPGVVCIDTYEIPRQCTKCYHFDKNRKPNLLGENSKEISFSAENS